MEETAESSQIRQITTEQILDSFEAAPVPVLTAPEVADAIDCSSVTARKRLEELVDADRLARKEVGARAVVYIRLEAEGGRLSGYGEWKNSLWDE